MSVKKPQARNRKEIKAILLFCLSLFFFLALSSYHPHDPSFSRQTSGPGIADNLLGLAGSYVADLMVQFLGFSSLLVPFFLLFAALNFFFKESFSVSVSMLLSFLAMTLAVPALLSIFIGEVVWRKETVNTAGLLGETMKDLARHYLNETGAIFLYAATLLISLMLLFDLSLLRLWRRIALAISRAETAAAAFLQQLYGQTKAKLPGLKLKKTAIREYPAAAPRISPPQERPKRQGEAPKVASAAQKFQLPPLSLLEEPGKKDMRAKKENLMANSRLLEKKLADFGVEGRVAEVKPGPVITMYELEPAAGVKITRIANLADDMALAMKAQSVRIVAPIPGKAAVGLEIPNPERETVRLKEVLQNEARQNSSYRLPIALGVDIVGTPVMADLIKMPHLLIAGTTGSGKSVALNAMICSILFKSTPDEVKLLMIDPKRLELSSYEGIPHLLHPVVVDPKLASQALKWAVGEMERRYKLISEVGVKGIDQYNRFLDQPGKKTAGGKNGFVQASLDELWSEHAGDRVKTPRLAPAPAPPSARREKLPYIVIVIDELADLMIAAQRNVEESLARLAQMSRAAGIHLILATQRPSVDVITGVIKANFPTRISFQVSSKVDSRTILDQHGAEKLLGAGDMLFIPPGSTRLVRIHGVYVSDQEIEGIVNFIKSQAKPAYDTAILNLEKEAGPEGKAEEEYDDKYDEAVQLVTELGQASISLVQRHMKIGYNRAARIIERMELEGVVAPSDGIKPRKVLARKIPR